MDSLSTDIILLTIGGDEKTACRTGEDLLLPSSDGSPSMHGRFSWRLAQALLATPTCSSWIAILAAMERVMPALQGDQPLLFRGQITERFGIASIVSRK